MGNEADGGVIGGGGSAFAGSAVTQDKRGRFTTGEELTEKQKAFCRAFVANGGKRKLAAIASGYAHPASAADKLMRNPAVVEMIRRDYGDSITGMAGTALETLKEIMQDKAAPSAARVSAAKWVLEGNGFGLAANALFLRAGGDQTGKALSSMSIEELEAMAKVAEAAVEVEIEVVRSSSAPLAGGDESQDADD